MKQYQFLLIDLDHTIFDFDLAQDKALRVFLKENDVPKEKMQEYIDIYVPLNHDLWKKLEKEEITKKELVNTRFSRLFQVYGIEKDGAQLAKHYEQALGQFGDYYQDADTLLACLKQAGYQLYALTNGISAIQNQRLKQSNLNNYFDAVFISEEIGFAKPKVEFFELACKQIIGFDKKKAVMIGDSLTADIQGAIGFGIDSIHYNPNHDISNLPTYTVRNYQELMTLLGVKQ